MRGVMPPFPHICRMTWFLIKHRDFTFTSCLKFQNVKITVRKVDKQVYKGVRI